MANAEKEFLAALSKALAPSTEAVTIGDKNGLILFANDEVERVYHRSKKNVMGKHPLTFCPKDFSRDFSKRIFDAIRQKGGWDGVVMNEDAKRKRFPILLRTVRVDFGRKSFVISWAKPFPEKAPFKLSSKQAECFKLLGQGLKPKEIAAQLQIAVGSVKKHLERVRKAITNAQSETDAKSRSDTQFDLPHLAVCCHEAGWSPVMKINTSVKA